MSKRLGCGSERRRTLHRVYTLEPPSSPCLDSVASVSTGGRAIKTPGRGRRGRGRARGVVPRFTSPAEGVGAKNNSLTLTEPRVRRRWRVPSRSGIAGHRVV
ncbi:hypothetical protein BaRGS_00007778 [Batillaria attramentaria]|uniref:Uncharacterized protein n=1 Tax=Batillaria attramentaria TaxID=370345 RepID=A0ABD0LPG4_9CAEN